MSDALVGSTLTPSGVISSNITTDSLQIKNTTITSIDSNLSTITEATGIPKSSAVIALYTDLKNALDSIDPDNNFFKDNSVLTEELVSSKFVTLSDWDLNGWVIDNNQAICSNGTTTVVGTNWLGIPTGKIPASGYYFMVVKVARIDSGSIKVYNEENSLIATIDQIGTKYIEYYVEHADVATIKFVAEGLYPNEASIISSIGFYRITDRFKHYMTYKLTGVGGGGSSTELQTQVDALSFKVNTSVQDLNSKYQTLTDTTGMHIADVSTNPHKVTRAILRAAAIDHTHTLTDLGAAPLEHTHTPDECSAAPVVHTHTPTQCGAAPVAHTHTPAECGASPANHTHVPASIGAAEMSHTHTPDQCGAAPVDHLHASTYPTITSVNDQFTAVNNNLGTLNNKIAAVAAGGAALDHEGYAISPYDDCGVEPLTIIGSAPNGCLAHGAFDQSFNSDLFSKIYSPVVDSVFLHTSKSAYDPHAGFFSYYCAYKNTSGSSATVEYPWMPDSGGTTALQKLLVQGSIVDVAAWEFTDLTFRYDYQHTDAAGVSKCFPMFRVDQTSGSPTTVQRMFVFRYDFIHPVDVPKWSFYRCIDVRILDDTDMSLTTPPLGFPKKFRMDVACLNNGVFTTVTKIVEPFAGQLISYSNPDCGVYTLDTPDLKGVVSVQFSVCLNGTNGYSVEGVKPAATFAAQETSNFDVNTDKLWTFTFAPRFHGDNTHDWGVADIKNTHPIFQLDKNATYVGYIDGTVGDKSATIEYTTTNDLTKIDYKQIVTDITTSGEPGKNLFGIGMYNVIYLCEDIPQAIADIVHIKPTYKQMISTLPVIVSKNGQIPDGILCRKNSWNRYTWGTACSGVAINISELPSDLNPIACVGCEVTLTLTDGSTIKDTLMLHKYPTTKARSTGLYIGKFSKLYHRVADINVTQYTLPQVVRMAGTGDFGTWTPSEEVAIPGTTDVYALRVGLVYDEDTKEFHDYEHHTTPICVLCHGLSTSQFGITKITPLSIVASETKGFPVVQDPSFVRAGSSIGTAADGYYDFYMPIPSFKMKGNWLLELGNPTTETGHSIMLRSAAISNVIRVTTDEAPTMTTTYKCSRTD